MIRICARSHLGLYHIFVYRVRPMLIQRSRLRCLATINVSLYSTTSCVDDRLPDEGWNEANTGLTISDSSLLTFQTCTTLNIQERARVLSLICNSSPLAAWSSRYGDEHAIWLCLCLWIYCVQMEETAHPRSRGCTEPRKSSPYWWITTVALFWATGLLLATLGSASFCTSWP